MSTLALPAAINLPRPAAALDRLRRDEPILFGLSVLILLAMLPTGVAALVDDRMFQGVSVWQKPWKFQLALVVYVLTLAWFARFLPEGLARRPGYRMYSAAVAAAIILELAWIGGAAALGTGSHFNTSPVGAAIYPVMGALATLLTSLSAFYAWAIARNDRAALAPGLKLSLVLGLALVLPLTLVTAGFMSSFGGHAVGGVAGTGDALFLLGWSREHGDLRVAHFFATHALHIVPLFGLFVAWVWGGRRTLPIWLFSAAYAGLVGFAFVQALAGRPFLPIVG